LVLATPPYRPNSRAQGQPQAAAQISAAERLTDEFPKTNQVAAGLGFQVNKQIRCRDNSIQVGEYLLDHHRVFNTGNDLDGTTAFVAFWRQRLKC